MYNTKEISEIIKSITDNGGITIERDNENSLEIKRKMNLGSDFDSHLDLFDLNDNDNE